MKAYNPKPAIVLTDEQIANIEKLAAYYTCEEIAGFLEISESSFYRIRGRDSRAMTAYKKGKGVQDEAVTRTLYELIKEKDVAATIFYLKAQRGWSTENPFSLAKYDQELADPVNDEREAKRARVIADALDKFDEENPVE